jgi:fructose-1,6-bisphosphatase/inositol monophosphatase family enzyme
LLEGIFKYLRPRIIRGISQARIGINNKGDVTKYFDKFCEKKIISMLRSGSKMKICIISEELKKPMMINKNAPGPVRYVIIDPVDGSDNYLSGVPFVCLGIAVFDENMEPLYSLAGNYYTGDYFYADRQKLFLNGKKFDAEKAAKTPVDIYYFAFTDTTVNLDNKFRKVFLHESGKVRSLGATIGELMLVIKGGSRCFIDIRGKLTPENFAPFFLIVKHTKCVFTDAHGKPFFLRSKLLTDGYDVVFSNNAAEHKNFIKKLKDVL